MTAAVVADEHSKAYTDRADTECSLSTRNPSGLGFLSTAVITLSNLTQQYHIRALSQTYWIPVSSACADWKSVFLLQDPWPATQDGTSQRPVFGEWEWAV